MELIDREAVKDITKKGKIVIDEGILECENLHEELVYILKKVEEFLEENIESIPTIESRPKGEWVDGYCSNCGAYMPTDSSVDFIAESECNFCYSCGADMREKVKS